MSTGEGETRVLTSTDKIDPPGEATVVPLHKDAPARVRKAREAKAVTAPINADEAAALVAQCDRAELLRFGAASFLRAHDRDGEAGAEVENRNALLIAQACVDALLKTHVSAV